MECDAGETVTLDEILNFGLPNCHGTGSSASVDHQDRDRQTHATEVLPWDSFSADVSTLLQSPEVLVGPASLLPVTSLCLRHVLGALGSMIVYGRSHYN